MESGSLDMDISDEENQSIEDDVVEQPENVVNDSFQQPNIHMMFNSINHLFEYYRSYGFRMGFGVSKRSTKKVDGLVTYVTIGCNRFGTSKNTSQDILNPHPITKTNCKAKLSAKVLENGKWCVTNFGFEHNHILSPGKSRNYRCNRKLPSSVKRRLELNDRAGIRMNKNFDAVVVEAGGHDNLPFLEKDCRNYINKVRRLRLGEGDANSLHIYFKKVQSIDANFFYTIDYDEDNRIRNLFWADARCRAAYEDFGDVITFDTTYLTNKYDMPFAPFVGVNHHGQSILLGCGLISGEDTDSFAWLFKTWLSCMGSIPPNAIITDQDRAMQNAIQLIFPNARHRWCLWHILKKIPEKLRGFLEYETIKFNLLQIVYNSLYQDQFEVSWNEFLLKFSLQNNEWLSGLYAERHRWVPAFVKDCFWAGMSTTQRSESINAFFDGYVNAKTSLKQFVEQYDNALKSKVAKEKEADFKSFNSWIPCVTFHAMEKQIQDLYTTSKFKEFQHELTSIMYCKPTISRSGDAVSFFEVSELQNYGANKEYRRRVNFKVMLHQHEGKDEVDVKCNCRLFEFRGILCRHTLSVLIEKDIFLIPAKYVLKRWRKDIKRRHTKTRVTYSDWNDTEDGRRYDKICIVFHEVAELAYESDERCDKLMDQFLQLKLVWNAEDNNCTNGSKEFTKILQTDNHIILSPLAKRCKGRPPTKRKQSKVEQIIKSMKKTATSRRIRTNRQKEKKSLEVASKSQEQFETHENIQLSSSYGEVLASQILNICNSIEM